MESLVTTANAKRWQAALDRALTNALDVLVSTSGEAFVESASRPGLLYQVSRETCSCPAGQKGQICQHRACYLAQIGELGPQAVQEAGVRLVCENSDRYMILIDGELYGSAVATEYGGWELFRGHFPKARRLETFCSLEELERDLTTQMLASRPVRPAAWVAEISGAVA